MLGWWEHYCNFDRGYKQKRHGQIFEKTHGLRKLYISFFFAVLNSSTQNIQFPKNQTHYTYSLCSGSKDKGCKNLAHTSKTRQVKHSKWLQLPGSRFDCYFSRLQRIECKETVARKDVRLKLPLCCHYWNTC